MPAPTEPHVRQWLLELTSTPTAAGREQRVIDWISGWLDGRAGLVRRDDPHGNIEIALDPAGTGSAGPALREGPPVYFTAHMDHPAFVVERVIGPATLELAFRGGVMDDYFPDARVVVHTADGRSLGGVITGRGDLSDPDKSWMCDLDEPDDAVAVGDFATWDLPPAEIIEQDLPAGGRGEVIYTNACDDLAALVAALAAIDRLCEKRRAGETVHDCRVLLTRAEEIGFIGAIGASRDGFMPRGSRIIALENSRSFEDSPIGGGPIVRVGDRVSVFSPSLTGAVAKVAERISGGSAHVRANQKNSEAPAWRWQRKLMAGGACEASVFCHYGYESTCVCLPLGNYHNMADLTAVQAGTNTQRPRVGREHVAVADFQGMVDLLVGCGEDLPETGGLGERLGKLWETRRNVLS